VGEEDGGIADIAAIGFANADKNPAKELIVILKWNQQHAFELGTAYEVRIFDDARPGQSRAGLHEGCQSAVWRPDV
jgi:hypothetical protein